jgi:hypothetical protein
MFDSLPSGGESAANQESLARCAWVYSAYGLLGAFGAVRAFFWRHGPAHISQSVCFLVVFVLAGWFLFEAIKNGPPIRRKLHRRWYLLFVLSMLPLWVKVFLM